MLTTESEPKTGAYSKVRILVDEWLILHRGEKFTLDIICRDLEIRERDNRQYVAIALARRVDQKKIEKVSTLTNTIYRYIDNTITYMNWRESKGAANLSLNWPSGTDQTQFGFDGRVLIPEKGLIVLAGVTNTGKSVFCRNFLWMNMDLHNCTYFSSETSEDDFADYASRMTWASPVKEDGTDKFKLVWRDKDFKDVLDPDGVNIVDWLNIYDSFYQIGEILDGMKAKLNKGIILVAIQKDPNKGLGVGGMWAEHKASLYVTMDFGRITVEKAKKWTEWNPNKQTWGFDIVDQGTHFCHIRLLKRCGMCWNGKKNNQPCSVCDGTGYVNADKEA